MIGPVIEMIRKGRSALFRQGRFQDAFPLAAQAVDSGTAGPRAGPPDPVHMLNNLAELQVKIGDYAAAESLHCQARISGLGASAPSTPPTHIVSTTWGRCTGCRATMRPPRRITRRPRTGA